jgi:hypothetical protein
VAFKFDGFDASKSGEPIADMRVARDELAAAVEVYSPVEWEGLDYFVLDAWDTLRQIDLPYEYLFRFDVTQLPTFDADGRYRQLHPEELSRGLDRVAKRRRVLQPLFDVVEAELEAGCEHVSVEQTDDQLNISLRVELEHIGPLSDFEPRAGTHGGPSTGGYRPEVIFRDAVGRALSKAGRRQARTTGDDLAVLIVDMSRLPLESELGHAWYQERFGEILSETFPRERTLPVDILALCGSRGWRSQLGTFWAVWDQERTTRIEAEALLGRFD